MALATSLASARVGRGCVIIDSSICVAVITGRPRRLHERNDALLRERHFLERQFHAEVAARDHDAVGRAHDASMFSSAESFSILATTSIDLGISVRSSAMSCARRTKLSARYSRSCSTANAMSSRSLSVIDGADTFTPGRLIPLWLDQVAAVEHARRDARLVHLEHHELDQPVVDQDAIADVHVVGEWSYVTGTSSPRSRPPRARARRRRRRRARASPADRRCECAALQVAEDGDRPVQLLGDFAHERDRRARAARACRARS